MGSEGNREDCCHHAKQEHSPLGALLTGIGIGALSAILLVKAFAAEKEKKQTPSNPSEGDTQKGASPAD